jgi:hypothetical protein
MNIQKDTMLPYMLTENVLPRWTIVGYIIFYEHEHRQMRSPNMMIFNLCRMFLNFPLGVGSFPWDWTFFFTLDTFILLLV